MLKETMENSHWGKTSRERLGTCDVRLQMLFNKVVEGFDCSVICGHRTKAEQDKAVSDGASKTHYPNSRHNTLPIWG